MKPKLYVFDISNFIHRAFHGMGSDLATDDGFPTGAIYGVLSMMTKFIKKERPENILICYDYQGPVQSLRKSWYPEYKANRGPAVNAVSGQELVIREVLSLLDMHGVEVAGYEADDLIGLAVDTFKDTYDITIMTGDKDLFVLIDDEAGVCVHDSLKGKTFREAEAFAKFGVKSHQISDYLAIVGDSSDNIKGIPGLGKKAAENLLGSYESIEAIYESIEDHKASVKNKLIKGREDAEMSARLTRLVHPSIILSPNDIGFKPQQNERLLKILQKLQFSKSLDMIRDIWALYK
jgi:DNA polymerase-1